LDAYVHAADPSYQYALNSTITGPGFTDYVINMTSQTWRSASEVNHPDWQHWLQIIVPTTVTSKTDVLQIGGGSNSSTPPTTADSIGVLTATSLGAITTVLPTVPNEPLTFTDDGRSRTEDQIIAYTFNKFLNGGDQNWPLLLPMVKSAVRAMDTTQAFVSSQSGGALEVDDFIVSGASKRGWTTWLTPAVDSRVRAIVPFVFDISNFAQNIPHLKDTYVGVTQNIVGGYPIAVQDYTNFNIFDRLNTPEGNALNQIVDPFQYFDRPTYNIPKYLVYSTGDQFFVPNASQYYFDALPGQNYLRYVPNTGHGLNLDALTGAINYEKVLLSGAALPQFSWNITDFGTTINVTAVDAPVTVKMWQATNPDNRDLRIDSFGPNWTSSTLTDQGGGHYVAHVDAPATGVSAFMVELTYNVGGLPLTFTTQVSEVPLFTPDVVAADPGGVYNGQPFAATGTANGPAGFAVQGSYAFTYFPGTTPTGAGSSTPPTNAGTYTVIASFTSADPSYVDAQSAPVTFTVARAATTVAVASSANPSIHKQSVTFTAVVTAQPPGGGTPGGMVTFLDNERVLGTAPLNGSGVATFTTSRLAPGSHTITASYGGDINFTGSTSAGLMQKVTKKTSGAAGADALAVGTADMVRAFSESLGLSALPLGLTHLRPIIVSIPPGGSTPAAAFVGAAVASRRARSVTPAGTGAAWLALLDRLFVSFGSGLATGDAGEDGEGL
jgi:PhoPQ-activated pathogenicity-related protein